VEVENLKNPQRVFSYFCSFHPHHFYQNSNWCDSPFKLRWMTILILCRDNLNSKIMPLWKRTKKIIKCCTATIASAGSPCPIFFFQHSAVFLCNML
jgi:hypothetical protein